MTHEDEFERLTQIDDPYWARALSVMANSIAISNATGAREAQ